MRLSRQSILNARQNNLVIPSFNVSYLPMVAPIIRACRDANSFGQIALARADWLRFGAGSLRAARNEYERHKDPRFVTLHLDHVPVVEDGAPVDYEAIIGEAIELGYDSVMVDGSMLALEENIAATQKIVRLAHAAGVPVEAEVGAVVGYQGLPLPYEELWATRQGFTDVVQARRLVAETSVDWLSVAVGNVHGALTEATRHLGKVAARLDVDHLRRLYEAVGIPLVLHGGSGIPKEQLAAAFRHGIAKINIATAVRQPYETARHQSVTVAQRAVYEAAYHVLTEELNMRNSAAVIRDGLPVGR